MISLIPLARVILRPSLLRMIPAALVSVVWSANVALAYIRGKKIINKDKENVDELEI